MINNVVAQLSGDQWTTQNFYLADTVNPIVIKATDNSPFKNVTADTLTLIYKTTYIDTANHPPLFTVSVDSMKATIKVGQTYVKTLKGFDGDANDTLRFVVSSPLSLRGKDTVFWLPKAADIGQKACFALVYDKKQAKDSIGWTIVVLDSATPIPNHPPVFVTNVSEILNSVDQNKHYLDTLVANDQDVGQNLTFSIVTGPTGLTIGGTSGILSWTPTNSGVVNVAARVMDDSGAHADIGWTITVVPVTIKINHPPQFVTKTMNMTQTATVGTLYRDTVTATDPDSGAVVRFSVVNGPVAIDQVSGIVTWTPTATGNFSVTARVTDDSGAHVDLSWPITVHAAGSVTDADGNTYDTVVIGAQTWTKQNLKTTKYNDGASIPCVSGNTAWSALTSPGYCWYNNDSATTGVVYGALYNWYAVNTQKLAPVGWHVPTKADWSTLINYLGGWQIAGGKMKAIGMTYWDSPNAGATNTSGFTALPGGFRNEADGAFYGLNKYAYWWASDSTDQRIFYTDSSCINETMPKKYGLSVRCVKN
jgi:uncharacterized protein (TIGR02145 family)